MGRGRSRGLDVLAEVLALRERVEVRAPATQSCRNDRRSVGRVTAPCSQALDVEIAFSFVLLLHVLLLRSLVQMLSFYIDAVS